MIPTGNQRWLFRSDLYRPLTELIDTSRYDVAEIHDDRTAKRFVVTHHYSGSYPAARRRFGLYRGDELQGVAVFSMPCRISVLRDFPGDPMRSLELGRFVLLDCVPGNGESWFLARCFEILRRQGFIGVIAFSDPVPRQAATGETVFPGHIGTIYQASNARYLGRATPRTLLLLPDGRVLSDRCLSKIRRRERGWVYSSAILQTFGADAPWADAPAWLRHWLPRLTRPLRHPGNHKYAFGLDRRARRRLPMSLLPFPKLFTVTNVENA